MSRACGEIEALDLLGDRETLRARFKKRTPEEVDKWVYKFPGVAGDTAKMAWNTYLAIIRRNGLFKSTKGQLYDWMSKLYVKSLGYLTAETN